MVLKLANSLEVPLGEQNNLLGSAGFAPMFQKAALDDDSLAQAKQALDIMLQHHEPYPCLVVDQNWNMLMANNATYKLFGQFVNPATVWQDIEDDGKANLVRLALHPKGLKPYMKNWDVFASYFINSLYQELRINPYAIATRSLLEEIEQYPNLPVSHLTGPVTPALPFMALELSSESTTLKLFTVVSTFGSPHDITLQQLRIETFFPADTQSEETILALAS